MVPFFTSLHTHSDLALLLLRLTIGYIFLYHGWPKLKNMTSFMGFIGVCETLGGAAIFAGVLTQLAALGIGIIMIGAIYKKYAEWHVPFSSMEKTGWEFDLMILAGCIVLFVFGSGVFAVDPRLLGL